MSLVGGMLNRLKLGVLHELGLEEGLKDLLNTWQFRHPKINLHYQINLKGLPKTNEIVSVTSYRIIQECLTNISRHAKAKNVEIRVAYIKKNRLNSMIDIEVIDDGVGFNKSHRDGFGLTGMRERINEMNGKIDITSEINQGVRFNIQLPIFKKKK
jgi:two-component system sensor histidine kinase UhpB